MKMRVAVHWRHIDSETGADTDPPRPGEIFIGSTIGTETLVLRETGDGAEFVAIGTYSDIMKKFGGVR